jgi:hypothetical protein
MALKSISFLKRNIYVKHELITELVKGKKVVHYGCVDDDKQLIKQKFEEGYYLHKLVTDASKKTIGVDLNKDAFDFLEKKLKIQNVVYGDVENPETFDLDKKTLKNYDVLLIPDLIEHLNNPGNMLEGVREYFNKDVVVYIFTPNPFAWYNFAATLLNKEIYTDYHTMYFTTESMDILLKRYDFKIKRILPVVIPKQRGLVVRIADKILSRIATFISPGFADAFMYECVLKKPSKKSKK